MPDHRWLGESTMPTAVIGLGVGLFVAVVATQVAFNVSAPSDLLAPGMIVSVATTGPFTLWLVYGGHLLRSGNLDRHRYPRVGTWCGGGFAAFLGLNLVMIVVWPPGALANVIGWALFAASVGGSGGLAIGIVEARAIERARTAERAAVRAEHLESQREWLDYLTSLLRHEVLNNANVIDGYASLLAEENDDELMGDRLSVIRSKSQRMMGVIDDVRVLVEAAEDGPEPKLERLPLAELLHAEAKEVRNAYPEATIEVSVPEGAYVLADSLLERVFSNLLTNAVEHNDTDRPHVCVTAERAGETMFVRIGDDGPGIPEVNRETLFSREATGNHGLGLYLVRTLVERYDGSVELTDTGQNGSTFTVELTACPDKPTANAGATGAVSAVVAVSSASSRVD